MSFRKGQLELLHYTTNQPADLSWKFRGNLLLAGDTCVCKWSSTESNSIRRPNPTWFKNNLPSSTGSELSQSPEGDQEHDPGTTRENCQKPPRYEYKPSQGYFASRFKKGHSSTQPQLLFRKNACHSQTTPSGFTGSASVEPRRAIGGMPKVPEKNVHQSFNYDPHQTTYAPGFKTTTQI